jgi:replication initiation and membrane attachment protein
MLTLAIGEKERQHIEDMHRMQPSDEAYEDISASFGEVFHPDLNHQAFNQTTSSALLGRTTSTLRKPFDAVSFQDHLQKLDVNPALFQDQLPLLIDYATLYGLDELALSELLLAPKVSNLMEGTINFDELTRLAILEKRLPFVRQRQQKKMLDSPSTRAAEINQMETLSPFEFLQLKQNGATPSAPDLKLAEELHFSMQLPYPVINALFDYVLRTQENTLPKSLVLKIAASLGRENLKHAIDTLDYFVKVENKGKKPFKIKPVVTADSTQKPASTSNDSEDLEAELRALK